MLFAHSHRLPIAIIHQILRVDSYLLAANITTTIAKLIAVL